MAMLPALDPLVSSVSFIALYGLSYGVVLFLISVGLVVTMGLMRVINIAHGAFAAVGGYLAVDLMQAHAVPFLAAVLVAVMAVGAGSVLVERVIYVRLYRAGDLEQILTTIGLMFLVIAGLNFAYGPDPIPASPPSWLAGNATLAGQTFEVYRLFIISCGLVVSLLLWLIFDRTRFGAKLRAAVDNPGMAQATGIDVRALFAAAFALGSGLAALGGALGFAILPLEPLYPMKYLALVLIVVTLAGFGNIKGSLGVAIMVGLVDTAGRYLVPSIGGFVVYLWLIGFLLYRHRNPLRARRA